MGADAVPVVADGSQWVPGVDLAQVAALLNVDYEDTPALSPDALIGRLRHALSTSTRLTAQFPTANLSDRLPNRDRTNLALANHIVEIAAGYLKVAAGADFDHGVSAAIPESEAGREALAARSDAVVTALARESSLSPSDEVGTFFGPSTLHAVLERCTWHVVQHVRQQAMLLEALGIAPDRPLGAEDFDGLPLPAGVWDG